MQETTRTAWRAAVAATLAIAGTSMVTAQRPYWTILIAVAVLNDTWGSSLRKTWQRVGMTGAGCVAGWALHFVSEGRVALERGLLLVAIFFAAFFRKSSYPWMTFFITVYVAFLFTVLGQWSATLMLVRLEDTVLGGLIAVAAMLIIPAPRVSRRLEEELSVFWQDCRAEVEQGFRILAQPEAADENWRETRRTLLRHVEQLETWARETDYETFLHFRSAQKNRRIFRATVLLCHYSLGFHRMARLSAGERMHIEGQRTSTLQRFAHLQDTAIPFNSDTRWDQQDASAMAYFGQRLDDLLMEIHRDL